MNQTNCYPASYPLETLLDQTRRGDRAALGALYDRFSADIFRYLCRRTGDAEVAADLTAEVFVRVIQAIDDNRAWRLSFTGWLYRIARNLLIDHVRVVRRRPQCGLPDSLASDHGPTIEEEGDRQLLARDVRAAVAELKPEYAAVLRLRFTEDLSQTEVGRRLGKTEGTVKVTQHRALKALRVRMLQRTALQAVA